MDWPDTLGRVIDVAHGAVVPGHGEVVTRAFVEGQMADLAALAQLARRIHLDGISIDDALRLSPFPAAPARAALTRALAQLDGKISATRAGLDDPGCLAGHHQILAGLDAEHRRRGPGALRIASSRDRGLRNGRHADGPEPGHDPGPDRRPSSRRSHP